MSVRTKGRRKIIVKDKSYVWYVALDHDSEYYVLNIISSDKSLLISCPLGMKTPYIISKGSVFQNEKTNGCWNRYLLPFHVPEIITPKFVSEVIQWVSQGENAVKIAWNGKDVVV